MILFIHLADYAAIPLNTATPMACHEQEADMGALADWACTATLAPLVTLICGA